MLPPYPADLFAVIILGSLMAKPRSWGIARERAAELPGGAPVFVGQRWVFVHSHGRAPETPVVLETALGRGGDQRRVPPRDPSSG